jgi:hypothetical protein
MRIFIMLLILGIAFGWFGPLFWIAVIIWLIYALVMWYNKIFKRHRL